MRFSGRYRSALIIGLQGIRARKLRTLLSMISLFLGVLAVVVVQSGAEVAQRASLSDVELVNGKDGTRQIYVSDGLPVALDALRGRTDGLLVASVQAVLGEPGVTPVNAGGIPFDQIPPTGPATGLATGPVAGPAADGPRGFSIVCDPSGMCQKVDGPGRDAPPRGNAIQLNLVAVSGDLRQFRPFRPVSGRWLDFGSAPSLAPRLVLNKEAAKGLSRYPVPAQLHVDGDTADPTPQIVGVVDDGQDQPNAYVRTDELTNWLPVTQLGGANSSGPSVVLLTPGATDTEQILRTRLLASGVPAEELQTQVVNARKHIESQLALLRWLFLGLAGVVLLIGVAGILNVGLATVGERVEELALRRAVGTPRTLLAGIVLTETLLTGLLTAAAAIGVAVLALHRAGALLGNRIPGVHDLSVPWQAAAAGIAAGLVAGLLGGLIPAIRAARIPIASVMRA